MRRLSGHRRACWLSTSKDSPRRRWPTCFTTSRSRSAWSTRPASPPDPRQLLRASRRAWWRSRMDSMRLMTVFFSSSSSWLSASRWRRSWSSARPRSSSLNTRASVLTERPTARARRTSRCFLGQPFQGQRFKNYVEIDATGLNVTKGRDGVYVIPGEAPLDITRRLISWGAN